MHFRKKQDDGLSVWHGSGCYCDQRGEHLGVFPCVTVEAAVGSGMDINGMAKCKYPVSLAV